VHNGNLIPLEDLNLPEGEEVDVTIAEAHKKDARAFRRSAGSWKGLVDAEKLIRDIYRDRFDRDKAETPVMTARYLVDTDWAIHLAARRDHSDRAPWCASTARPRRFR